MSHPEIEAIKDKLADVSIRLEKMENTVTEVKDILTSFKMLARFAKWITAVGAAGLFVYKLFKQ